MVRLLAFLSLIPLAVSALPSRSISSVPFLNRRVATVDALEKKASSPALLDIRGGGVTIDKELYVKASAVVYGLYGAKCLLQTKSMVTDHFDYPEPDTMMQYWIRGMSGLWLTVVFCFLNLPTDEAVKACLIASATTGLLYPWNAKFGYIAEGLSIRYPMHYLPEVLFAVLTIVGILALNQ